MKDKLPLVTVVTVNYNGRHLLGDCFDSLSDVNYPKKNLEIIMVDNGSKDGSIEFTKKSYPYIKILKNDINNYCKANNLAIAKSKGKYVALLNNDTKVDKDWLIELVKTAESDKKIGAAGSKVLFSDGRIDTFGHEEFPDFYWSDKGCNEEDRGQYDSIARVRSISGCAVIYRKQAIESVGYFDEDFNMYMEDVDLGIRLDKEGWKLVCVPQSLVRHTHHGSVNGELALFLTERNRLLFVAKHYPQKLSACLLGSGYFTAKRSIEALSTVYNILGEVVAKLIKHHHIDIVKGTLSELFNELQKLSNYENNLLKEKVRELISSIENNQKIINEKESHISSLCSEINKKDQAHIIKDETIHRMTSELTQREEILKEKDGCINSLNLELGKTEEALKTENNSIQSLLAEIQTKESLLKEKERETISLVIELAQKDELLKYKEESNNRLTSELVQKDSATKEKDQLISDLNIELVRKSEILRDKEESAHRLSLELTQKEEKLKQKEELAKQLNLELFKQNDVLRNKDAFINDKELELAKKVKELSVKDDELKSLRTDLQAKDNILKEKDQLIADSNIEINRRDQMLRNKDESISRLALELSQKGDLLKKKEECISNLNLELDKIDSDLHQKDGYNLELNLELSKKTKELEGVYNSTAFRFLVRPLWTVLWSIKQQIRKSLRKPFGISPRLRYVKLPKITGVKDCADKSDRQDGLRNNYKARLICYYLPQFYPVPENDAWWGKGFTEWTNVAKAKPLFRGHHQPNIPADLGFYDLRVAETRTAQAELAKKYGIEGFCYWHYWFGGRRILQKPFSEVLKSGEPNFPFCLGWANESWTGIWYGAFDNTLIEQVYHGKEDEEAHFYALLDAFYDKRYITIEGKPVFYIYQPHKIPECKRFVESWQRMAAKSGLKGLYLIGEDHTMQWNPQEAGFDASVPHSPGVVFHKLLTSHEKSGLLVERSEYYYSKYDSAKPKIFYYEDYIKTALQDLATNFLQYPSILPNWDNTPRCGFNGFVLINSTPELFRIHLKNAIEQVSDRPQDKRVIFVKSWNEWAEGNHLEPDLRFGRRYLEVCRDEVLGYGN